MDKCTPSMLWASLTKLICLPKTTIIFCAHEYTERNIAFASYLRPDDVKLPRLREQVRNLRSLGEPTVPSLLEQELLTNPFLMCGSSETQEQLRTSNPSDAFAAMRKCKDLWNVDN